MTHLREMLDRLPTLYRDGELLGDVLGTPALALEIFDDDRLEVLRSHFFDAALERGEAERLAGVLDIPAEPWQVLGEYRAWVHALRNARQRHGSVTVAAIVHFVVEYAKQFKKAVRLNAFGDLSADENGWIRVPPPPAAPPAAGVGSPERRATLSGRPLLLENPPIRRWLRVPVAGGIEPLQQFALDNRGLDPSTASFLLTGLPGDPECTPALVNVTTGQALIYLEALPTGKRLWIRATADGGAVAELEGNDVTARLRTVHGIIPGEPWSPDQVDPEPRAIRLERGTNEMWFLPIALFDAPGLDRYLLALADLVLRQGRFDETSFNAALFYQWPAAQLQISWVETQPACFRVDLPWSTLTVPIPAGDTGQAVARALEDRAQLLASLDAGVARLRGAGIDSSVRAIPLSDVQRQRDRLVQVMPIAVREHGTTGADRLIDASGTFDVTGFEHSTFG